MLITLVIIGVVAALTIPNLMTKYQQHVFENQFKKSLYTISQIVARTRSELGVSGLCAYCIEYNTNYYNSGECGKAISQNLINVSSGKKQSYHQGIVYDTIRNAGTIRTYNNKNDFSNDFTNFRPLFYTNKLQDGSYLGFVVNSYSLIFGVDLNGNKKPNRLGYDIFLFSINNKNDTITGFLDTQPTNISDEDAMNYSYPVMAGTPCNLESERAGNGIGCAYYALRNKCPYDNTKTYWECLK